MPRIVEVFGEQAHYHEVKEGSTINEFMLFKNPELKNFPVPVIAGTRKEGIVEPKSIDDVMPILRKDWDNALVTDDIIVIVAVLQPKGGGGGGGSANTFQIVLGVVLLIVAAIFWWVPGLNMGAYAGGVALLGAGMLLGGVVGMLTQPKLPSGAIGNEEASPTYSLNGSANQARLLQPIPEGFGTVQSTPDVVAQPYYTYKDNDQYLFQVFGIGRGTYNVEAMSFGEEMFWRNGSLDFNSSLIDYDANSQPTIRVEIVPPGNVVTLFPDNVESNQNVKSIQLFTTNAPEYTSWMGPYVSSPPGTHGTRFQVDILYPRGIGKYNDDGGLESLETSISIQYQKIDDFGSTLGLWENYTFTKSGTTLTSQRVSVFFDLEDGRYQFRFRNNKAGNSDTARPWLDDVYVDGLRCYLPGTLKYTQSVIAIEIKATNLLSTNAQQQFRVVQTRVLPIWNPGTRTWSAPVPTRRLDAAIAQMCKSEWGGRLTDDRIDLDALAYCQSKCDENGWNFDTFIDSAYTVLDLIIQSCLPYRVFPRLIGDKVSFLFDEKNRPVKHVFTPRDIMRGTLKPSWATHSDSTPDDVIVSYLDEEVFYARREVQATLPYSESREPKYLQYPIGICNRKTAHDYGVYVAACNRYRRLSLEFSVETLGRILYVGDVVSVQHPRLRSAGFGKVVDWDAASRKVYVDTMPTMDAAPVEQSNLWMVFNDPQGRPWGSVKLDSFENCCATLNADDYATVSGQQGDLFGWLTAGYQEQPTTWALQTGRNIDRRYIIQNVSFQDLEHASLTLMNDDPRVFEQNVPMPPWEYRQNNVMWTALTPPENLLAVYTPTSGLVRISWTPVLGAFEYELEFGGDTNYSNKYYGLTMPFTEVSIEQFAFNKTNYFRVRAADRSSFSKWTQALIFIGSSSNA